VVARERKTKLVTAAARGALGLTLSVGLSGCYSFPGGLAEPGGVVRELTLSASPTPGMRLSYLVHSVATISGAGTRSVPGSHKSASVALRYVVEVTAVRNDSFDVRLTSEHFQGVITARFDRGWSPLKFGLEDQGQYADLDLATFPILGEAFRMLHDLSGRWTVGATRPSQWTVNLPPHLLVTMQGKARLKKIGSLEGRRAAEFDYEAIGEGEYAGSRVWLNERGQSWIDLATGFALETRTISHGEFSHSGQPVQLEIKEERTLERSGSAGL
jgi:hypothetical protein